MKSSYRPFVLPLLLLFCTLFYYFGELVDLAAWNSVRLNFFYGVHDIHRLLFLAPIIYAGYYGRIRGAIIVTLISFLIFLPRAFFISPYPDPLLRMLIFTVGAGVIGCLVGRIRNEQARYKELETTTVLQRDRMLNILNGMADGVLITGPDYRIRYANSTLIRDFGDFTGKTCYEYLKSLEVPCAEGCKLKEVISRKETMKWKCLASTGKTYEVSSAPYTDADGATCQISIFRNTAETVK